VGIFIAMLVAGIFTVKMGYNLDILGQILFFSLLTILIARVINTYVRRKSESVVPSKIISILFALFVVYDTNKILQRNYGGNFVNASLDYFLDIINLIPSVGNE
jgi:FtsH-binding integral membrane protein